MKHDTRYFDQLETLEETLGMTPGWLFTTGIITLVVGLTAVVVPQTATLAVELMIGVLLLAYGIVCGVNAFQMRSKSQVGLRAAAAVFYCLAGVALLLFPVAGVVSLTIIVGAFLILAGADKISLAFVIRPSHNWAWLALSGVLDLALALLIFFLLPQAAVWILGLLMGVSMIFNGMWLIMAGAALKHLHNNTEDKEYEPKGNESYR